MASNETDLSDGPAPKKAKVIKSVLKDSDEKRLIVILEKASLETVKVMPIKTVSLSYSLIHIKLEP